MNVIFGASGASSIVISPSPWGVESMSMGSVGGGRAETFTGPNVVWKIVSVTYRIGDAECGELCANFAYIARSGVFNGPFGPNPSRSHDRDMQGGWVFVVVLAVLGSGM